IAMTHPLPSSLAFQGVTLLATIGGQRCRSVSARGKILIHLVAVAHATEVDASLRRKERQSKRAGSVQRALHRREGALQVRAEALHANVDCPCDPGRDQAVLDRGRTALVAKEFLQKCHGSCSSICPGRDPAATGNGSVIECTCKHAVPSFAQMKQDDVRKTL